MNATLWYWQYISRILSTPNGVLPLFATSCMYWGHLCLFHRGISHLDFIQNGLDGIFNFHVYLDETTNMFPVYLQYGIEDLLWF